MAAALPVSVRKRPAGRPAAAVGNRGPGPASGALRPAPPHPTHPNHPTAPAQLSHRAHRTHSQPRPALPAALRPDPPPPSRTLSRPEARRRAAAAPGLGRTGESGDRRRPGRPGVTRPQRLGEDARTAGRETQLGSGPSGGRLRRCRASPLRGGWGGVAELRVSAVGRRPERSRRSAVSRRV